MLGFQQHYNIILLAKKDDVLVLLNTGESGNIFCYSQHLPEQKFSKYLLKM